jgi:hypothetical protein
MILPISRASEGRVRINVGDQSDESSIIRTYVDAYSPLYDRRRPCKLAMSHSNISIKR